jgi:hypothetical protein
MTTLDSMERGICNSIGKGHIYRISQYDSILKTFSELSNYQVLVVVAMSEICFSYASEKTLGRKIRSRRTILGCDSKEQ